MPKPWKKRDLLVVALPAAVVADLMPVPAPLLFLVAALAVVPLAGLIGRATEPIAAQVGGAIGALLNATFGTFAEFVIAALLVLHGQIPIVKASVVGSLVANLLLLLGVSIVLSSYDRTEIAFRPFRAYMPNVVFPMRRGTVVRSVDMLDRFVCLGGLRVGDGSGFRSDGAQKG